MARYVIYYNHTSESTQMWRYSYMCLLSSQIYMIRLNTTSIVIGNPIIMCYTYCRNEFYVEPYIACVYAYLVVTRNATHYQWRCVTYLIICHYHLFVQHFQSQGNTLWLISKFALKSTSLMLPTPLVVFFKKHNISQRFHNEVWNV